MSTWTDTIVNTIFDEVCGKSRGIYIVRAFEYPNPNKEVCIYIVTCEVKHKGVNGRNKCIIDTSWDMMPWNMDTDHIHKLMIHMIRGFTSKLHERKT